MPSDTSATSSSDNGKWVGKPLTREEDRRLITGHGKFVDDEKRPYMRYLALYRSPYAHAEVEEIDTEEARNHPDVDCVITGEELVGDLNPFMQIGPEPGSAIRDYPMAVNKARFQGEPVVAILTDSRPAIEDVTDLVDVEYDRKDPVVNSEEALEDSMVVHEETAGTNEIFQENFEWGDVDGALEEASYVVEIEKLHMHRFTAAPLENNACLAQWEPEGNLEIVTNNTFPAIALQQVTAALDVPMSRVECKTKDVGGSFGIKINNYPYMTLAAYASKKLGGHPVKWVESRSENLQAAGQSNERTFRDIRVALDENGVITGIEAKHIDDAGAYPRYEPLGAIIWAQVTPGTYRFDNLRVDFSQVTSNKCPTSPVRGYSRMQHLWFLERTIDVCGHELDFDADEIRRRNYIKPDQFPYETPNGCVYGSGNYPKMLSKAKELIGWDDWKEKQKNAREDDRWLGIGIGTTLDSGTNNFAQSKLVNEDNPFSGNSESAKVWLESDGSLSVATGTSPSGQGHQTTIAQTVADELGVHPDLITVKIGFDTEQNTYTGHSGTYASQFAVTGLSAVYGATRKLKDELERLASYVMEADVESLDFGVGEEGPEVRVEGGARSVPFWQLANMVYANNSGIPEEFSDITLSCKHVYKPDFGEVDTDAKTGNLTLTYAAQLHIAVIEIDKGTYNPKILDYSCVDDCGNVINPMIVEGQVHGAAAHGIGGAFLERSQYDESGNLLTTTFSDYAPITSVNMPELKFDEIETPSPFTFNGAKGMGEGGGAPFHTISAALQDALYEEEVLINESFNSPSEIHDAVTNELNDWEQLVSVVRSPS